MTYDASLGYDDAMPDAYDKWIEQLDSEEWTGLMDKFAHHSMVKTTEFTRSLLNWSSNPSAIGKSSLFKPMTAQDWLWDYFAEHVYPDMGAVDGDALYEQQRDAQNDN